MINNFMVCPILRCARDFRLINLNFFLNLAHFILTIYTSMMDLMLTLSWSHPLPAMTYQTTCTPQALISSYTSNPITIMAMETIMDSRFGLVQVILLYSYTQFNEMWRLNIKNLYIADLYLPFAIFSEPAYTGPISNTTTTLDAENATSTYLLWYELQ